MFEYYLDFLTVSKTCKKLTILAQKYVSKGAYGAICASHLFGVLLLFSAVNIDKVRDNLIE